MIKYAVIFIIFISTAAYVGISIYIASALTVNGDSPLKLDKKVIGDRVADVVFRSKDNAQLAGWFYQGTNDKAIIFVHGAGNQNRANEVYGTPDIARYFYDKGYTMLLFDLRGTGQSEKTRASFGQYEANDVAGAYEYMVTQEYKPQSIAIVSDSLGAIATIMAADSIKDAGAIVLDSPATEVKQIVSNIMKNERKVPTFLHPGSFLAAKLLYKIDVDAVRPIDKISVLSSTPLLFLNGEKDTLIEPFHTEELMKKAGTGKRVVFSGSKHVEGFKDHPEQYLSEVEAFFDANLSTD